MLSDAQIKKFLHYSKEHQSIFSDRVIRSFFAQEENIVLFLESLDGLSESQKELEEKFRRHFFQIRFIHFLVSTVRWRTLDQLRNQQKWNNRFQLIFDKPLSDEDQESNTLGDQIESQEYYVTDTRSTNPEAFLAVMENDGLNEAFSQLSEKQKLVLTLRYALCYQDSEIARLLKVSKQAVCKTRNVALLKLKTIMMARRRSC